MKIKVFHPYFKLSLFCKEWIKNFNEDSIKIYHDENFDVDQEIKEIKQEEHLVFLFPLWWYNPPWNLVKWFEDMALHKNIFKNKKIDIVVMVGGHPVRYDPKSKFGIVNMNKWINEYLQTPQWTIYYECIPKNFDRIKMLWKNKGYLNTGAYHE